MFQKAFWSSRFDCLIDHEAVALYVFENTFFQISGNIILEAARGRRVSDLRAT